MKTKFVALLLLSSAFTPAVAEDIKTTSHIDAVTVYPQGADIVRISSVDLKAGEHTLLLEDLPGSIEILSATLERDLEEEDKFKKPRIEDGDSELNVDGQTALPFNE